MLKALIELIRPMNCMMAAIAVFIGYSLSVQTIVFDWQVGLLMLSAFLICAGGQTVNDIFDVEVDLRKNPNKPIPSNRISGRTAHVFAVGLFVVGTILAFPVNIFALAIAASSSFLLYIYSAKMKTIKWIGNFVVGLSTGLTFIFGATISMNLLVPGIIAASALFSNLGRELLKDLEDKDADSGYKVTLAHIFTENSVLYFIAIYFSTAMILAFIPCLLSVLNKDLNGFLTVPYLLALFAFGSLSIYSFALAKKRDYLVAQKMAKYSMIIALIGFILAGIL